MKKVIIMMSLITLMLTSVSVIALPKVMAQSSGSGSTAATPSPPAASPLFAPQDPKYRFEITLPKLGWHFPSDANLVTRVVNFIVSVLSFLIGGAAFAYVIYGGILYMTAGGDPGRVDAARKTIIGAVIGIFIATLAYVLVQYVIYTVSSV